MKPNWKALIISILIPLAVGAMSAILTTGSMESFAMLSKPPLSPPGWLFPVVWTILFTLMGISSYLVYVASVSESKKTSALTVYAIQLAINFFWSIIFFNFRAYTFAFIWLLLLIAVVVIMIIKFYRVDKPAAYLQLPYLAWLLFAGYLNLYIALMN